MFRPLPALPRRNRGEPLREAIPAEYLNQIAAQLEELDRRTRALAPVSSGDLVAKTTAGGTTYALRRRGAESRRRGRFAVFWARGGDGESKVFVAPGVVRWRRRVYLAEVEEQFGDDVVVVTGAGSFSWFDLVPEVDSEPLAAPAVVGDDTEAGNTLYLRVKSDGDLIPQSADFVWSEDPPDDVHDPSEAENLTHFPLASMSAELVLVPRWQGDIMLPITIVEGDGTTVVSP